MQMQIWNFCAEDISLDGTCLYSNSCEMLIDAVSLLKHNIQIVVSMNNETWSYSLLSPSSDPSQWSFSSVSRLQNTFQTEQNHWWCQCQVSTWKIFLFIYIKFLTSALQNSFPGWPTSEIIIMVMLNLIFIVYNLSFRNQKLLWRLHHLSQTHSDSSSLCRISKNVSFTECPQKNTPNI